MLPKAGLGAFHAGSRTGCLPGPAGTWKITADSFQVWIKWKAGFPSTRTARTAPQPMHLFVTRYESRFDATDPGQLWV